MINIKHNLQVQVQSNKILIKMATIINLIELKLKNIL